MLLLTVVGKRVPSALTLLTPRTTPQRGVMEELAGKSAYVRQIEMDRQKMRPMITDLCEQVCLGFRIFSVEG